MQFSVDKKLEEMTHDQKVNELEQMIAAKMVKEFGGSIENAFNFADGDASGAIDKHELRVLLRRLDIQVEDDMIDALMNRYDDDNSHAISAKEFELRYRFHRIRFVKFLEQRQEENELLLSTPYTMLFFVVFVVLLYVRDQTPLKYAMGNGFASNLFDVPSATSGIAFTDIFVFADFYEWVEEVLIPQTLVQSSAFIEGIPLVRDEWGRVSVYGALMGTGLVFKQERSEQAPCDATPLGNLSGTDVCYTAGSAAVGTSFGLPACQAGWPVNDSCYDDSWLPDDARAAVETGFHLDNTTGYSMFKLNASNSIEWNRDVFTAVKERGWVDRQTRRISIEFGTYNGEVSIYSFVSFQMEVLSGGYVQPEIPRAQNLRSAVYEESWLYGLEALWLFLVVLNAITEFREMATAAKEHGGDCKEYWTEDGWNYVDWVQILLAIASSLFFFTIVADTTTLTQEYAAGELVPSALDEPEPLLVHLTSLLDKLLVYRGIALFNMVILLLRFFKAFRGQPRLAVITRTFVIAGVDVAHFLLIFFCILMAFVAAAVFLFGQHVERYHQWWKALGWCFWSLTGEFFWEEVHLENPTMAIIWWWSYLLVMYLVLTNMFIAMVIDSFNRANAEQASKTSMVQQIIGLCKNSAQARKGCIKLEALIEMLSDDADDKSSNDEANGDGDGINGSGDLTTRLHKAVSSQSSERSLGGVYAADDVESAQKILAAQKLVSLIDVLHVWKRIAESTSEDGTVSEAAAEVTEQYLISLMGDFCVWNANEDDEMRGVLEKNALVKLMEMDTFFVPVQKKMLELMDGVYELVGEAHIEGEDGGLDSVPLVDNDLDDL